jgi:hypothetical protein
MGVLNRLFGRKNSPERETPPEGPGQGAARVPANGPQRQETAGTRQPASRVAGAPGDGSGQKKKSSSPGKASKPAVDPSGTGPQPVADGNEPADLPSEFESGALGEMLEDLFDDALQLDSENALESASKESEQPRLELRATPELRETFAAVAAVYVRPLRHFLARLKAGPVATEWVDICLPAVGTVGRSALKMGVTDLGVALDGLATLLSRARADKAKAIDGSAREAILQASSELEKKLPQAFALEEDDSDERDGIIVLSLLRQIPDVGTVTLDKIFGAGLASVELLACANTDDLARTTGISAELSKRVCISVQEYRKESGAIQALDSPVAWLDRIKPALDELELHHEAFLSCSADDDPGSDAAESRRTHRRKRQTASLRMTVLLAEMGEMQLVNEFQKLPFGRRIEQLRKFVKTFDVAPRPASTDHRTDSPNGVAQHG